MVIAVVGIGLDGVTGLTQAVRDIVEEADVLVGGKRHLGYFQEHSGKKLELNNLNSIMNAIAKYDAEALAVVILTSGDPLFFGLGRLLLERFNPSQLEFYPHLSSVQIAFNRLKIPWQDATLISVHGRSLGTSIELLKQGKAKIAILTDSQNNPSAIARLFLSLELPVNYSFYICENLGAETEKISHYSPLEIDKLSKLERHNFANLNVLILIREIQTNDFDLTNLPTIGIPDSSFLSFADRPGLITKKEVRLAVLGELALQPQQTVWDIGAGTGSVSIEIARLCPTSQIYAVEKTGMGSTLIVKNSQRFQVDNILSINGKAPDILQDLPECDRIFIGGSGGDILNILHICNRKLKERGLIVLAFATIEYQLETIGWLNDNNWQYRLLHLQISRSTPISHLTRMTPLNPVTIITTYK